MGTGRLSRVDSYVNDLHRNYEYEVRLSLFFSLLPRVDILFLSSLETSQLTSPDAR